MKSAEQRFPHLLEPRSILGPRFIGPLVVRGGARAAETIEMRAAAVAEADISERSTLVVVQGRPMHKALRSLNGERQADRVLRTAANIRAQEFAGDVAITATVNAPGFAANADQRRKLDELGVNLIEQKPAAPAVDAINAVLDQSPTGAKILVPIMAGNRFVTNQALRTASLRVGNESGIGAFGPRMADMSAHPSKLAYTILNGDSEFFGQYAQSDRRPSSQDAGFMSDAGAAVDLHWLNAFRPTSPDLTHSGIDLWAAENRRGGLDIWYDPALAVHDSTAAFMSIGSLIEETSHQDW